MPVVIFLISMIGAKNTDHYQSALKGAVDSPAVQAELGIPMKPGSPSVSSFATNYDNGVASGHAKLEFGIEGPKGSGRIHYSATEADSKWTVDEYWVTIDGNGKKIPLSP